ncbi:MAG: hypothetical protein AAFU64_03770 [Bacteroidota bacterium]
MSSLLVPLRAQERTKLITKKWIMVDLVTPRLERNFEKRGISQERREVLIAELVADSFIDFKSDGTYEVSILGSEKEKLFWRIDAQSNNQLVVRKTPNDREKQVEIEELSKKRLIIIIPDIDNEYSRLYFAPADDLEASSSVKKK